MGRVWRRREQCQGAKRKLLQPRALGQAGAGSTVLDKVFAFFVFTLLGTKS
jgi:hypothetical protein